MTNYGNENRCYECEIIWIGFYRKGHDLINKFITDPFHRFKIMITNFFSQFSHVHINCPVTDDNIFPPNRVQN